jgi:hypothetical protein
MDKLLIIVKEVITGTSTNAEAMPLFILMDEALTQNKAVVLSLKNCKSMSSSFLNSSIGCIVDKYGFDLLKGRLSIVDFTPFMGQIIKDYIGGLKTTTLV